MHPIYADFEKEVPDDDEETPREETEKMKVELADLRRAMEKMEKKERELKKKKESELKKEKEGKSSGLEKDKIDSELVTTLAKLKRAQADFAGMEKRISDSIEDVKREAMIAAHARDNGRTEINHLRLNVGISQQLIEEATEARRLANIAAVTARAEAEVLMGQYSNAWRNYFATERDHMDGFVTNARARSIEITGHTQNAARSLYIIIIHRSSSCSPSAVVYAYLVGRCLRCE
jgi:hypothetical protein